MEQQELNTSTAPQHPFTDRLGRNVLEKKITFAFLDNQIVCRGAVKVARGSKELNNYREEYLALEPMEVPAGWHTRKEFDFFYNPNAVNLQNILTAKMYNNKILFAQSFAIFLHRKIKQAIQARDGLAQVKDLTLEDEDKIKALPDLIEKRVPDFLHQKIASRYAYYLHQCGLLEEQGLGKTKTAIETFVAKKEEGLVDRCLVVGPLSVINRNGWGKQIGLYAPTHYTYTFIKGKPEEKLQIINGDKSEYDFYLLNYEGIENVKDDLLSWVDDRTMIILDESSKIKNFHAKRTKNCIELGNLTPYKMILTGTPITQNAHDIFSQFYFLDSGDTFGTSYEKFLDKFFKKVGFKYYISKANLEAIHDLIFDKSVRFTKEVIKDLPEKTYQVREVKMTPLQQKFYNAILAQEIIRLESIGRLDAQNILVTILRLQQITSGFIRPRDDNKVALAAMTFAEVEGSVEDGTEKALDKYNPKLAELMDLLEELGDKPVVIWTRFKYDVFTISKELEKRNITYITYIGGMNEKQREESEAKFLRGDVRVFLSIPSAGGFGMNLQRASYAIYYCNDYSLQNRLQSEDRVHRMGQKSNVNIIDLCCKGTIDYEVLDVLTKKKEIADIVTGDTWKEFLRFKHEDDDMDE